MKQAELFHFLKNCTFRSKRAVICFYIQKSDAQVWLITQSVKFEIRLLTFADYSQNNYCKKMYSKRRVDAVHWIFVLRICDMDLY